MSNNIKLFYLSSLLGNVYFDRAIWILYFQKIGISFFAIGVLQALVNASMLVFDIPAGYFADKFGRKNSILIGRSLIVSKYIILLSTTNVYLLGLGSVLFGAGMVFIMGADQAFLYDSVENNDTKSNFTKFLGNFNGLLFLVLAISMACGGFIQKSSWSMVYLLTTIFQVTSLILTFWLKEKKVELLNADSNTTPKTKISIRDIKISTSTKWLIFALSLYWAIASIYDMFNQKLFSDVGLSVTTIALIYAFSSPIIALFSMFAHKFEDKFSSKNVLVYAFFISTILFLGIIYESPLVYVLSFAGISCIYNLTEPILFNKLNKLVSSSVRATFLSYLNFLSSGIMFLFLPGIGLLGDKLGLDVIFVITGVISCILCIVSILSVYKDRFNPSSSTNIKEKVGG
ncbi:MFS transporter [Priestia megaterium]|uniref:MFS transporter n=1 Tax=Priestia megaterium TaxID=1404 RepID=UPI000CA31082|nr:MFS transporter [Priestia megaterium]AUO14632.1 MFS transporter [Priestia megaterium]